jgi:hypothetical protein
MAARTLVPNRMGHFGRGSRSTRHHNIRRPNIRRPNIRRPNIRNRILGNMHRMTGSAPSQ